MIFSLPEKGWRSTAEALAALTDLALSDEEASSRYLQIAKRWNPDDQARILFIGLQLRKKKLERAQAEAA